MEICSHVLVCGDPWVGKMPWRRERLPTPVFWPGEFHGLYSPWDRRVRHDWATFTYKLFLKRCKSFVYIYICIYRRSRHQKKADYFFKGQLLTPRLHFHFSLLCIGEGNSNPLQCSCLENPRDGVAQSRTRLKWLSSSSSLTPKQAKSQSKMINHL